jgi:hypothetical protein
MEVPIMPQINIRDFPEDLHHRSKVVAAMERITHRELVVRAITEYVERAEKPRRKKGG